MALYKISKRNFIEPDKTFEKFCIGAFSSMVEHSVCIREVKGSNPLRSTFSEKSRFPPRRFAARRPN